ncbi:hypothetical protein B5K08_32195 [Rhizobium leguminosarum bv. trifolii]|uniref:Uncharacterized protein n=1 Tax=Rhizobium leguminosarum bv. trifolii TaxID=386 RepID=A0A3E1AZ24_RHILT|nr:hypothetical protein B5K10_32195 [Rhizobium leguminosarum bv. trifolii]RFB82861.1 hypothetical protein B5K08_32195 [Rhizobium leguminosarum bv. trifolii]
MPDIPEITGVGECSAGVPESLILKHPAGLQESLILRRPAGGLEGRGGLWQMNARSSVAAPFEASPFGLRTSA